MNKDNHSISKIYYFKFKPTSQFILQKLDMSLIHDLFTILKIKPMKSKK